MLRELVLSNQLTIGDLHRDVWDILETSQLPAPAFEAIRELAGQLPCPSLADAIPAGLPLSWVAALPLRTRTRNAVRRLIPLGGIDTPLAVAVSAEQLLSLPSVGPATLVDLLCVIEGAELAAIHGLRREDDQDRSLRRSVLPLVELYVRAFAAWAVAETDFPTLGSAISHVSNRDPTPEVWRLLADIPIHEIADESAHPYVVLGNWANQLAEREQIIFGRRVARPDDQHTLQQLADELGVTRERVRQVEKSLEVQMNSFIDSDEGTPIRWRIDSLRRAIGVAAPSRRTRTLLRAPEGHPDLGPLLLELSGPYEASNGWLVLRSASKTDPSAIIRDMADEFGRIDPASTGSALSEWGLDPSLHEEWLLRDGGMRSINGYFVRWDGPIANKLAFALADLGSPATAEELLIHIDEDRAATSAKNAMAEDDRFVRANRTDWALASWGLPEYSGIASAIRRVIEGEAQPMRIVDVIARVCADFGIAETSARAYCDAPMFVTENGWIRLRQQHEPFEYQAPSLRDTPGLFALGEGRVGLLCEVDRDVLRGSGRQLSLAAGALLGLKVNDQLTFKGPTDTSVTVTFPSSSFQGPSIGSTRGLAEEVSAGLGELLTVVLDRTDMSAEVAATDLALHEVGWPLVARLTGIDAGSGLDGLAAALHCSRGEVRAVLRARGDDAVLRALPAKKSSPDLEEALAELDAEMQPDWTI